jgi:hypothetical protein
VVFLPDTALLVPGAAGRADPAAGLRRTALAALRNADPGRGGRVLVVAPGRRDRHLTHPVVPDLGAAGLDVPLLSAAEPGPAAPDPAEPGPAAPAPGVPDASPASDAPATPAAPAARADVAASTALLLLRTAGIVAPADVLETARTADRAGPVAEGARAAAARVAPEACTLVVVGSLSARHGPDAPLADDPRAAAVDARLVAALGSGPLGLARALGELGAEAARELAISGWVPWHAALGALDALDGTRVAVCSGEVVAGAQHAVALWLVGDGDGVGSSAPTDAGTPDLAAGTPDLAAGTPDPRAGTPDPGAGPAVPSPRRPEEQR